MNAALESLNVEVSRIKTVRESVKAAFTRLAAIIEANKNAPAALQAIVNDLRSNTDEFVNAVAVHTTAEAEPPVEPAPEG